MIIGYSRTSTTDQVAGIEAQQALLRQHQCERIFSEHASAVSIRPQLEEAIAFARKDDVFVVTSISRLARSVADCCAIQARLAVKGVTLRILDLSLDTSTPTGALILNVLSSISQFERELLLERQKVGIAKAKAEGRYTGRQPTARAKSREIVSLRTDGERPSVIARKLQVSVASVYRVLADHEKGSEGARMGTHGSTSHA